MHLCRSWVLFGAWAAALAPVSGQAMTVYKWTDAQGVVHYSDQPVDGAEQIITSSGPAHNGILGEPASNPTKPPDSAKKQALADTQVSISSPTPDQTFVGNDPIPVRLSMSPSLKAGQQVTWTLNGAQQSQAPDATEFVLTDLGRGTYTIEATVTDTSTGEVKSAAPVTFNVVRPSVLLPQHK
jgi:Domain of unknown function (DUF4124)